MDNSRSYHYSTPQPPPPPPPPQTQPSSAFYPPLSSPHPPRPPCSPLPYFPPPPRTPVHPSSDQQPRQSPVALGQHGSPRLQPWSYPSPNSAQPSAPLPISIQHDSYQQAYPQSASYVLNSGPTWASTHQYNLRPQYSPGPQPSNQLSPDQFLQQQNHHSPGVHAQQSLHCQPQVLAPQFQVNSSPSRPSSTQLYQVGTHVYQTPNASGPGATQVGFAESHYARQPGQSFLPPPSLAHLDPHQIPASYTSIGSNIPQILVPAPPPSPKPGSSGLAAGIANLLQLKVQSYLSNISAVQNQVSSTAATQSSPQAPIEPSNMLHAGSAAGRPSSQIFTSSTPFNQTDYIIPGQYGYPVSPTAFTLLPKPMSTTQRGHYSTETQYSPSIIQTASLTPGFESAGSAVSAHSNLTATNLPHQAPPAIERQVKTATQATICQVPGSVLVSPTPNSTSMTGPSWITNQAHDRLPPSPPQTTAQLTTHISPNSAIADGDLNGPTQSCEQVTAASTFSATTQSSSATPSATVLNPQLSYPPPPTGSKEVSPPEKKEGLLSKVISHLGQMQVMDPPYPSKTQTEDCIWDDDEPASQLDAPVRAIGSPDPYVRWCSKTKISYETIWYYLSATPTFLICSWCHETYIRSTGFASCFDSVSKAQETCHFNVPRVTKGLWPTACQTGDFSPVSEYIARRMDISDCKRSNGAVMVDKIKWFHDKGEEIPGFVACEACYEDVILGTGFGGRFEQVSYAQGPNDKYICDLSTDYIKRALEKLSGRRDLEDGLAEFVKTTTERMALPECKAEAINISDVKWYRPREPVEDLDFCQTCFMDELALTPYAREFEEVVDKDGGSRYSERICDLKGVSMREPIIVYLRKRLDINLFLAAAKSIAASPSCNSKDGIVGGKWYNLIPPVSNYGICEGCYAGIIVPHRVTQFFSAKPQKAASDKALWCSFNPLTTHYERHGWKFHEAVYKGVWAPYEDWVRKWAPILVCERETLVSRRAWYGWPDCPICQECYELFATGTTLAGSMPLQNTYLEEDKTCFMYSPRMREKYTAACKAGSADDLLSFSRERWLVYQQTVPAMKLIKAKAQSEIIAGNSFLALSTNHASIDAMDCAIGVSSSYGYYNGYYTKGVESKVAWDKGMAAYARANDPAVSAEISRLDGIWKAVE